MQIQLLQGLSSPQTTVVGGVTYTVTFTTNPPATVKGTLASVVPNAIGQQVIADGHATILSWDNGWPPAANQNDAATIGNITNPYSGYVSPLPAVGDQY